MSTVLFGSDGVVKLADFGLGKLLDRKQIFTRSLVGVSLCVAPKVRVARTLQMLTLVTLLLYVTWHLYWSDVCALDGGLIAVFFALFLQEVENGQPYDAKTDMYGLGCLGYEMASLK
jgi:serine/threonine protein kinase